MPRANSIVGQRKLCHLGWYFEMFCCKHTHSPHTNNELDEGIECREVATTTNSTSNNSNQLYGQLNAEKQRKCEETHNGLESRTVCKLRPKQQTAGSWLQFILRSTWAFLFVIENKDARTRCKRQTKQGHHPHSWTANKDTPREKRRV